MPDDSFGEAADMYAARDGSIYFIDRSTNRILRFDSNGKFVRTYHVESILEPAVVAVDAKERLYVVSGCCGMQHIINIVDQKLGIIKNISTRNLHFPTNGNGAIRHLEVTNDGIFAAYDSVIIKLSPAGALLSYYTLPPAYHNRGNAIRIAKDSKERLFFSVDNVVYKYDGEKSSKVAEITAENYEKRCMHQNNVFKSLNAFDIDVHGEIIGHGICYDLDLFKYNIPAKSLTKITRDNRYDFHSITNLYSNSDGSLTMKNNSGAMCKLSSDGKVLFDLQSKTKPKPLWRPSDIVLDRSDNMYVYDDANRSVVKIGADGVIQSSFDMKPYAKSGVTKMRMGADNRIYFLVADQMSQAQHISKKIIRFNLADMY